MITKRSCGILLHVTSLPSPYGIGDLGKEAYNFIDFLHKSNQEYWQVLPLNPVGSEGSPYCSVSAFAGNFNLISLDSLLDQGYLTKEDLNGKPVFPTEKVEWEKVQVFKDGILRKAFRRFQSQDFSKYIYFTQYNSYWLDDYAFFMALKKYFGGKPWNQWEPSIAFRKTGAMQYYRNILKTEINFQKFIQFIFFQQWKDLRKYANNRGIKIIGDLPIFISQDSCDVWMFPQLFQLDDSGYPLKVAGVPPDYFSKTGQLWGNPLYKWDEMEKDDYCWWRNRISILIQTVDLIRIDHFRGLESYWAIPAGEETAVNGKWVKGPGERFFTIIEKYLGPLPAIAEDLGFITPAVQKLKDQFHYPGMLILQFELDSGKPKKFLPENYPSNCVIYTGTHDNDTLLGWYRTLVRESPRIAEQVDKHLGIYKKNEYDICWNLIKFAYQTGAGLVIIPLQDVLCLDSEARMNFPGTSKGNWTWRFREKHLTITLERKMANLVICHGRKN